MNITPIDDNAIKIIFPEKPLIKFKNPVTVDTPDYRNLTITERNAFTYVYGFLMKKGIEKHTCDICINYAKLQEDIDESFLLCYFKAYENINKSTYEN